MAKAGEFGIGDDLGQAVMVAQVDEQQAAMVAHAVDPARQADVRADVGLAKGGAGVAAIAMHGVLPNGWPAPTLRRCARRRVVLDRWNRRGQAHALMPHVKISVRARRFRVSPAPRIGLKDGHAYDHHHRRIVRSLFAARRRRIRHRGHRVHPRDDLLAGAVPDPDGGSDDQAVLVDPLADGIDLAAVLRR